MGFAKKVICHIFANVLDKFVITDLSRLEAQLLGEARIVLRDVEMRRISPTVRAKNRSGEHSTIMSIGGTAEELILSWRWSIGMGSKTWVKDVNLTIRGADFLIKLEHGPLVVNKQSECPKVEAKRETFHAKNLMVFFLFFWTVMNALAAFVMYLQWRYGAQFYLLDAVGVGVVNGVVSASTVLLTSRTRKMTEENNPPKEEVKSNGGILSYVLRCLEAVIDELKLSLENFKLATNVPNKEKGTNTIVIGGELLKIESRGRVVQNVSGGSKQEGVDHISNLRQTLTAHRLNSTIIVGRGEGKEDNADAVSGDAFFGDNKESIPLVQLFHCEAELSCTGKWLRGLKFGRRAIFKSPPAGLVLYLGSKERQTIAQLLVMLRGAKKKDAAANVAADSTGSTTKKTEPMITKIADITALHNLATPQKQPSVYDVQLPALVVVFNKWRFDISNFDFAYVTNGIGLVFDADQCAITKSGDQKDDGGFSVLAKGVRGSRSLGLKIYVDLFERIETPHMRLLSPVENTQVNFKGGTLSVNIHRLQCAFLQVKAPPKKKDEATVTKEELSEQRPKEQSLPNGLAAEQQPNAQAPFLIGISIEELGLQKNDDLQSRMQFKGLKLMLDPTPKGTDVTAIVIEFKKKIFKPFSIKVSSILAHVLWPLKGSKLIENLKFSFEKAELLEQEYTEVFATKKEMKKKSSVVGNSIGMKKTAPDHTEENNCNNDKNSLEKYDKKTFEKKSSSESINRWKFPNANFAPTKIDKKTSDQNDSTDSDPKNMKYTESSNHDDTEKVSLKTVVKPPTVETSWDYLIANFGLHHIKMKKNDQNDSGKSDQHDVKDSEHNKSGKSNQNSRRISVQNAIVKKVSLENSLKLPTSLKRKDQNCLENGDRNYREKKDTKALVKKTTNNNVWKLPYVHIDTIKIVLSLEICNLFSIYERARTFTINAFEGNAKTTSADLIQYYTSFCMRYTKHLAGRADRFRHINEDTFKGKEKPTPESFTQYFFSSIGKMYLPDFLTRVEECMTNGLDLGKNTYETVSRASHPISAEAKIDIINIMKKNTLLQRQDSELS